MTQRHQKTAADLAAVALGFVAQMQGSWTEEALGTLRAELARQGLTPTEDEMSAALTQAHEHFFAGPAHLLVCMGRPCHHRQKFDASEAAMRQGLDVSRVQLSTTECQGPCKQAPVATLRVGSRSTMFAQFVREADWQAVRGFAQRAAGAGTLLTARGTAEAFEFDPVHEHAPVSAVLRKLQFLLGHFAGEGKEVTRPEPFQKELLGSWEAGGRCIALRMGVTYALADGRKDTHNAFVAIGLNPETDGIEARAYTDGGAIHDFHLQLEGDMLLFTERPDVHAHRTARQARKVFRPTEYGFEERLEVDLGDGHFIPHYVIAMQRVTPTA
ncbi:MAG: (2Fe-2S) ferredoxin domain-containing protein [Candidatus Tectomicrobia bacterium]|uniref:(2Fe-2S) ferredoxin domain-containing protein n=1 Tax=Tectimicrobiota bacterium TaxID=2528274 RepID=A0A938B2D1_UNCTE|nr:(2Fe-2S) ferredoxin domain-containing protein [Candidatus Tectomicrobia bacterium]